MNRVGRWVDRKIVDKLAGVQDDAPARDDARSLTDIDIEAFMHAAEDRPGIYEVSATTTSASGRRQRFSTTQQSFMYEMTRLYPLRVRRLRRDVRWLQKKAAKFGLEPEEVFGQL